MEEKEFYIKIHVRKGKTILAISDPEIIGKSFTDRETDFYINEKFYKGQKEKINEIINQINQADIINIVGNSVINELHRRKVINKKLAKKISGVMHIQIVKV